MASRASLNKVLLIGNLTRDPELRYTPNGNAVCTFGVATNRTWMASAGGEKREETEFHRVVVWNKLAELCSQLLAKGRKVYIEGRLQTRNWQTADGQQRQTTEIVASDMRILDSKRPLDGVDDISQIEKDIGLEEGTGEVHPEAKADHQPQTESKEENAVEKQADDVKAETEAQEPKGKSSKKKSTEETKNKKDKAEPDADADDDILSDLPF